MKSVRLICVTGVNNNKFYNLDENPDGTITAKYGRVGCKETVVNYPLYKWDSIYNAKIKKGYRDITDLKKTLDTAVGQDIFSGISEGEVISFIKLLLECSKNTVNDNYLISSDDVTQTQIDEAQKLIDQMGKHLFVGKSVHELNNLLLKLYTTLPRKMKTVQDYLVTSLSTKIDVDKARKLIDNEQSLFSTLESQIKLNLKNVSLDNENILKSMGLDIEVEKDKKTLDKINFFLGQNKQYTKNIFKVTNHKTQKSFDEHLSKCSNKKTALLWHGSRNENWLGILQQGLRIRPAGAIITGAMFGNGIYFANRSQKSVGYSSLKGSYWTSSSSNKGFIALFSVHTGNAKKIKKHDSSCYNLHRSIGSYDSVFAEKGIDLKNDEIIVYDSNKTTISYIIEMEK